MALGFFCCRQRPRSGNRQGLNQGIDRRSISPAIDWANDSALPISPSSVTCFQDSVEGQLRRSLPVSPPNSPSLLESRQDEGTGAGGTDGESRTIETSYKYTGTTSRHKSSFQVRASRRKGHPIIFLKNASSSHLSYWVIEEDRLETKVVQEKATTRIEASMNLGIEGTGGGLGGFQEKETTIEMEAMNYCLSRDHRVASFVGVECHSERAETRVMFPIDCERLRVIGFFRKRKGQPWRRFKDKVYLNDRRGATIYTIRPTNATLDEYVEEDVTDESEGKMSFMGECNVPCLPNPALQQLPDAQPATNLLEELSKDFDASRPSLHHVNTQLWMTTWTKRVLMKSTKVCQLLGDGTPPASRIWRGSDYQPQATNLHEPCEDLDVRRPSIRRLDTAPF